MSTLSALAENVLSQLDAARSAPVTKVASETPPSVSGDGLRKLAALLRADAGDITHEDLAKFAAEHEVAK